MPGKSDVQAGGAFVRLFLKDEMTKKLVSAVKNVGSKMQSIGRSIAVIGAGITAAGASIIGTLTATVVHFAAVGDELGKMSTRTGIAASALAELQFAAEQSGTELSTLEKAIKRQQKMIRDYERGLSTSVDAFESLGISLQDLQGLSPEDQFELITERLGAVDDATRKAAIAQEIFGRSGTMLIPMLGNLKALRKEARDLGIIPSEQEVRNAEKVTDAINRVRRVIKKTFFDIGASLADSILPALEWIKTIAVATSQWIKQNQKLIPVIGAVGAALAGAGTAIILLGTTIAGAGIAISGIGTAIGFLLSPIGAVTIAIAAAIAALVAGFALIAGTALYEMWQEGAFSDLSSDLKAMAGHFGEALEGIKNAIQSGQLDKAWELLTIELRMQWNMMLNSMSDDFVSWSATFAKKAAKKAFEWSPLGLASSGVIKTLGLEEEEPKETTWGIGEQPLEIRRDILLKELSSPEGTESEDIEGAEQKPGSMAAEKAKADEKEIKTREFLQQLEERAFRNRISNLSREQQEVENLNRQYQKMLSDQDASAEDLQLAEQLRQREIASIRSRYREQEEEEKKRLLEIEKQTEQQLADDVAAAQIRAAKDGLDERLALLEHEKRIALREAKTAKQKDLIRKRYAAERKVIEEEEAKPSGGGVAGITATFSAAAAVAMGYGQQFTPQKKMANDIAETKNLTKKQLESMEHFRRIAEQIRGNLAYG